jgi:glycosyltransferase involved in cell wall biosynthesis
VGLSIVHLVPHDGIGGVEIAARTMASRRDLPCEFKLLLIAGRTMADDGSRILNAPFRHPLNPLAQARALAVCLRLRPEILIVSLWRSVAVGVIARLLRPKMRLVYFLNLERPAHVIDALASRLAIACADEVWADSAATLRARIGQRPKASRVISFVTERQAPLAAVAVPRPRFVTWSRLNSQKGIDRALRFIAALAARGEEPRFDIWGPDDGEQAALERLAADLGISSRINFRGPAARDQIPGIAGDNSFFLQLSRFEGMAMGTVEAMQLGLVPVVTAVGEMSRYVGDGSTGVVVDPDDLEPGVERVIELLRTPEAYVSIRADAIGYWQNAPLYADDICAAASDLARRSSLGA